MRSTDRAKFDARLRVLESRRYGTSGARERLTARLDGIASRVAPVPAHEARAALVAGLAGAPDTAGIAALRRAVLRHG